MNTLNTVASLLGEILSRDASGMNASFRLSAANNVAPIDVAKLAIACERRFGLELHDEKIAQWETIGDACADIDTLLDEGMAKPALRTDEERVGWFYE